MLEATPSLALLSLLKMALAGEHSSYKGDFFFFALGKRCFLKAFLFLKSIAEAFPVCYTGY